MASSKCPRNMKWKKSGNFLKKNFLENYFVVEKQVDPKKYGWSFFLELFFPGKFRSKNFDDRIENNLIKWSWEFRVFFQELSSLKCASESQRFNATKLRLNILIISNSLYERSGFMQCYEVLVLGSMSPAQPMLWKSLSHSFDSSSNVKSILQNI